ncbi:unnamed protein product [Lactuca saligna]|uniref:Uncharacterized protein n=1 Tax=Lactuca saligna TaxID=75948 RepID=A0AA35VYL0_LACSI|nr:unnamed protein product [Lactuca saligna]
MQGNLGFIRSVKGLPFIPDISFLYTLFLNVSRRKRPPRKMKPQEMEKIIKVLIKQEEDEATALENVENDFYLNYQKKPHIQASMSRRPRYLNYVLMDKLVVDNTYEASKAIQTIYKLKREAEMRMEELKKEVKKLLEDDRAYVD